MKVLLAFALLLPISIQAQTVPGNQTIAYQGRLLNKDRTPVTGPIKVTFTIYADKDGASAQWAETQPAVQLSNGFYAVFLGSLQPLPDDLFRSDNRWLGVKVGDDAELRPLQKISSVPYALQAKHSVTADSATNVTGGTGSVSTGSINASSLSIGGQMAIDGSRNFTANNITVSGSLSGRVVGGARYYCNLNGSVRNHCTGWGTANCDNGAPCGNPACASSTAQLIAESRCYIADGVPDGYCAFYLCIQ